MRRWIAVSIAVAGLAGATNRFSQERWPGAGAVAVTIISAGGTFFTEGKDAKEPSFGNWGIGGLTLFDQATLDIPGYEHRGHGGVLTNVGR
jgi:hypothetical protein